MTDTTKQAKIVILGGGTGIHPVIMAASTLPVELTSIVAVTDSGGSTGILRQEYEMTAVGDMRQSLTGLADPTVYPFVGQVLEYRFPRGEGLKGHTLGNLLLTALYNISGSSTAAAKAVTKLFGMTGTVLPVSETVAQLEIHYADGTVEVGQHILNKKTEKPKKIDHISFQPPLELASEAKKAIEEADLIVIGPGDFHDSILGVLLANGITEAFTKTNARILYVVNLMTSKTRTDGWTAQNHVTAIEQAIGRQVMNIVVNAELIPIEIKKIYAAEGAYPVSDDLGSDPRVIRAPLLSATLHVQDPADIVERSLLRHSHEKIIDILKPLL